MITTAAGSHHIRAAAASVPSWHTDRSITIEILVKARLQLLKRDTCAARDTNRAIGVVSRVVGIPDRVLLSARHFPGNLVAACSHFRTNRRPAAELTCRDSRTAVLQGRACAGAVKQEIAVACLCET